MTREHVASTQPVRWPGGRSWLEQAACTQEDSEIFFGGDREGTRTALSYCRTCPVMGACLDFALANDQRYGVWGGLTEGRRRKLHDRHNEGDGELMERPITTVRAGDTSCSAQRGREGR